MTLAVMGFLYDTEQAYTCRMLLGCDTRRRHNPEDNRQGVVFQHCGSAVANES